MPEEDNSESLKWNEPIPFGDITFDSALTLIPRLKAESLRIQQQPPQPKETAQATPETSQAGGVGSVPATRELSTTAQSPRIQANAPAQPSQYHRLR